MNNISISSASFGAKAPKITKFYVPGKNNTTLRCNAEGDFLHLSGINCEVLKKGKVIETTSFHNKQGFNDNRLTCIYSKIQEKVRDGFDFMEELFLAQIKEH